MKEITVKFDDYSDKFIEELNDKLVTALEACGLQAERHAKLKCPVDTGRLRNSITHEQTNETTETVGSNVEYAPYVELGHTTPSGGTVPPQHFLQSAIEDHTSDYQAIIKQYLSE